MGLGAGHPAWHGSHAQDDDAAAMADGLDQETALRGILAEEPLLLGFVRAIVGSRTLAEDIFQDLVVLVMRKHAEIPNAAALPGWSRRAVRFLALKALEKRARERPVMDEELIALIERAVEDDGEVAVDPYLSALSACREKLSPAARELLALRYEQGIPGEQIAERLGRPLNTVYVTISRLHRTLADCIRTRVRGGGADHG
jgi:RNA polymerase sigma-70 factor (ECF subfamily)